MHFSDIHSLCIQCRDCKNLNIEKVDLQHLLDYIIDIAVTLLNRGHALSQDSTAIVVELE